MSYNNSQVENAVLNLIVRAHEKIYACAPLFGSLVDLLARTQKEFPMLTISQFNQTVHALKTAGLVSVKNSELVSLTRTAFQHYVVKDDKLPRHAVHSAVRELRQGKSEQEIREEEEDFGLIAPEMVAPVIAKAKELVAGGVA